MIADDADHILLLNVMCFDDYFLVKGKDTEVEHKEIVNAHYLRKGVDKDMRSKDNYLVPYRVQSEDVMIVTTLSAQVQWV